MRFVTMIAAAAAFVGGVAVANAADLSYKDTPYYSPAPAPVWGGLYVGGHIGGLWQADNSLDVLKRCVEKDVPIEVKYPNHDKDHDRDGKHDKKGGDRDDKHDKKGGDWGDKHDKKGGDWGDKHGKKGGDRGDKHGKKDGDWGDKKDKDKGKHHGNCGPKGCECEDFDWKSAGDHTIKYESDDEDGALIGGVHVGYNWQRNNAVLGVEADVSFADNIDYLASLRARVGYAYNDLLLYATGGVAFAGFNDRTITASVDGRKFSYKDEGESDVGFVVGGGVEYKIRPNLSFGVEALYYVFDEGKSSSGAFSFEDCEELKFEEEDDRDLFVVRARMSYHFQAEDAIEPLK